MAAAVRTEEIEHEGLQVVSRPANDYSVPSFREAMLAFLALVALAAATLGSWVLDGGFFLDDWADSAGTLFTPGGRTVGNVLSYFNNLFEFRPVLVIFTPLKYTLLGTNITLNLAWTVLLGVLVGTLIYTLLRTLRLPWYHAWLIAALSLVYPWYDSLRIWASANPGLLGIFIFVAGLQVALAGLIRRDWRWHIAALVLYLLSVLTYEITAPVIVFASLLYVIVGGWREARFRWAADVATVALGMSWVATHTNRTVSGLSADVAHLREIIEAAPTIAGRTLYTLGPAPRTGLALGFATVVLLVGISVFFLGRREGTRGPERGWGLREWLVLAGGGLIVAVLGWVMFIPADPYYTPSLFGVTNRVNMLSGYGLLIAAYAVIGTGIWVITSRWPSWRRWAPLATVGLGLLLGATYLHVLERHVGIWRDAYRAERSALDRIRSQYPDLRDGATVFTSNYPAYETLGVPIFAFPWDLNAAIKDEYENGELSAYPVLPGTALVCKPTGVSLSNEGSLGTVAPYGAARFLNLATGEHAEPQDRRECEAVASEYVAGPEYLRYDY